MAVRVAVEATAAADILVILVLVKEEEKGGRTAKADVVMMSAPAARKTAGRGFGSSCLVFVPFTTTACLLVCVFGCRRGCDARRHVTQFSRREHFQKAKKQQEKEKEFRQQRRHHGMTTRLRKPRQQRKILETRSFTSNRQIPTT